MNRKLFAVTALAALAGLAGYALESRPAVTTSSTSAPAPGSRNVETVVIQRTQHVRKRVKRSGSSPAGGAGAATRRGAPHYDAYAAPIAVRTAPAAPRVKTSPSPTGEHEADEREHDDDAEFVDDGESRDD